MSEDDFATGQASVEERQGWTEMLPAEPTPERDDKEYSSDAAGIQEAAKDLSERRQSEPELIERNYVKTGPDAGERVEPNKSLPFDKAVSDLSKQRQAEIVSEMQKRADALAAEVDAVRQGNIGPDSADNIEQAKAQAEAALAAYQAEAAPAI